MSVAAVAGSEAAAAGVDLGAGVEDGEDPPGADLRRDLSWGFKVKAMGSFGGFSEVLAGFCRGFNATSVLELGLSQALFKPEALALGPVGFPFSSGACFFRGDLPWEASAAGAGRFAGNPDGLLCRPAGTQFGIDKCFVSYCTCCWNLSSIAAALALSGEKLTLK